MLLEALTLPALASGCAILGAGGGGDTQVGVLAALQSVEDHGPVVVLDLEELPEDGLLMPCGGVGAPSERERELVLADLEDGVVTDREARDVYGLDNGGGIR